MRALRNRALVTTLVAVALVAAACGEDSEPASNDEAPSGEPTDQVTEQLESALADTMAEYEVPGAVVGVWVPDEVEWVVAEGLADLDAGEAVSTDMYWPMRSITKTFTVAAMLQLADEGQLSLDDTVDAYLDGVPGGDRITLRQLAAMESGLADYAGTEAFVEVFVDDPTRHYTLEELNALAFAEPLDFEPGAEHVYSNTNTNVVGVIVEQVTGQPIGDVIAERFLAPLELAATSYPADSADFPEPHSRGYSPDVDTGELAEDPAVFSALSAAGAMISQLDDLRTWVEALASGQLVDAATFDQVREATPLDEGPEYDAYGLGIGTIEGWWGHTGEGLGWTALIMHDPESGATVVVAMNVSNLDRHPPTVLFREIAGILGDAGLAAPETTEEGSSPADG